MIGPKCKDCGTPLLYECAGCSATNYPPQHAGEVQGEAWRNFGMQVERVLGCRDAGRDKWLDALLESAMHLLNGGQTVGQEPVAFQQRTRFSETQEWSDWKPFDGRHGFPSKVGVLEQMHHAEYRALYAVPPSQTVDLGLFNALASLANSVVHHRGQSPLTNGVFAEAERLLALMNESKDANNG